MSVCLENGTTVITTEVRLPAHDLEKARQALEKAHVPGPYQVIASPDWWPSGRGEK